MIPALVLTAGLATRLRPLSFVRAKAALPVAGAPLVRRILRQLAAAGVTDAVLNLHHLPQTIATIVGDGSDVAVRVRYSWETPVLGSAGGPRRALPLLARNAAGTHSSFLIVNGDTLTDVDIGVLVAAHRHSGALVTIAVVPNTEPDKYGGALVDGDGAITGFVRRGSSEPSSHVIGVQVAEAEAFAALPDGVPHESVGALYPALIAQRPGAIRAFHCQAEFFDIGTPADYLATSLRLAAREGTGLGDAGTRIDPTARVERSILWNDVVVEAGAMLRECVVTDGVRVPADTSWHGVSLRVPTGECAPGEREIDGLAVAPLDPGGPGPGGPDQPPPRLRPS
jgi:mannose-1-phosphate guanylyltransferase